MPFGFSFHLVPLRRHFKRLYLMMHYATATNVKSTRPMVATPTLREIGMNSLSAIERSALKARAHHLAPVVMVGDAGLTDAVLHEIDIALKSHELIKVRIQGDDRYLRNAHGQTMAERLDAILVQAIGKLLVLFRPRPPETEKPKRARTPAGPRRTKKQEAARAERKFAR